MVRIVPLALLLVACSAPEPTVAERLAARRIALDLPDTPLSLRRAMRELKSRGCEDHLKAGTAGLDEALVVENLLRRAQPETAKERAKGPEAFDRALAAAADAALALARGETDGAKVYEACVACHVAYRDKS